MDLGYSLRRRIIAIPFKFFYVRRRMATTRTWSWMLVHDHNKYRSRIFRLPIAKLQRVKSVTYTTRLR
jgi:hypothetical protein